MILIEMKESAYRYDAEALIKNFYPHRNIFIKREDSCKDKSEAIEEKIRIDWDEEQIIISVYQKEDRLLSETFPVLTDETFKNQLKIAIYKALSAHTGRSPEWGTLTGVRPVKLFMAFMEKGQYDFSFIKREMERSYLCKEQKISLGYRIAKKEMELLSDVDITNGYSIYIGIPFCPTTCLYCSFTSYSALKYQAYMEDYLKALFMEIDFAGGCFRNKKLTTIYIGGGTPTALSEERLFSLLKKVRASFDFSHVREFTVEAGRPDSITAEKLKILKEAGVTRISINPQTMKEATLSLIGRSHTVSDVKTAFLLAREAGHDNINMDLIAGLPEETPDDIKETLKEIEGLNPDSVTVHSLVTKRAARLNQEKDTPVPQNVDEMTEICRCFLEERGYEPYYMYRQKNAQGSTTGANQENIGYAKAGKEGIYNILIMEEKQTILALGAGASSKFVFPDGRMERVENVKSLTDYIGRIDEMLERKAAFLRKEGLYE